MRHKIISLMVGSIFVSSLFCAGFAQASDQVGTLTNLEGTVKVFTNPSKSLPKGSEKDAGATALYEGVYYKVQDAKVGQRLEKDNLLRTAPGAKARVVYDNGDQFNVGPATAMKISWDKDAAKTSTQVELAYGKVRGVVEHGGPRGKLMIRTKTATMGVRGTDFFVAEGGKDGGMEVSILRGAVEVKSAKPEAKPVEVKAGYSAVVQAAPVVAASKDAKAPEAAKVEPVVELRKTTQEELKGIQKSSVIEAKTEATKAPEIVKLEQKAVETTMKDIKAADPQLYAQLKTQDIKSTDDINTKTMQVLIPQAPKAPEKRKPYKSEIEDLERGAYDKYFKIVD